MSLSTTRLDDLQTAISQDASAQSMLLTSLSRALLRHGVPDVLRGLETLELKALTEHALSFLHQRNHQPLALEVFNPTVDAHGWHVPYTVVMLALNDRPFIVDSLRAELQRQNLTLVHLIHPILGVERDSDNDPNKDRDKDSDGGIKRLWLSDDSTPKAKREAFELYFLQPVPEREHEALEHKLRTVLQDVILATDDYRAMRDQLHSLNYQLRHLREVSAQSYHRDQAQNLEDYIAFLEWLDDDNFVFLGYREYDIIDVNGEAHLQVNAPSALGILRKLEDSAYCDPVPLADIPEGLRDRVVSGAPLIVTKANAESTVHRPARLDYIGLKKLADNWQVRGEQRFVGLFTSKALFAPVEDIPLLKRKLEQVIALDNAPVGSHDYKEITSIFNSMPREELFWSNTEELHQSIRTIMSLLQEEGVRLTLRSDPLRRGLAIMVIMPRDRFDADVRRQIQRYLFEQLDASHVDYQLAMGEDEAQVRFHFFFNTKKAAEEVDLARLEHHVFELTRTWGDKLEQALKQHNHDHTRELATYYRYALSDAYKTSTPPELAVRDIAHLEALDTSDYRIDIINPEYCPYGGGATHLKVYHHERTLVISDVLPLLENLGLRVLEQISYAADFEQHHDPSQFTAASKTRYLQKPLRGIDIFRVQTRRGDLLNPAQDAERIQSALLLLLRKQVDNDRLNGLVISAGLRVREVALLRTLQLYYAQIDAVTSRTFINNTLLNHPELARGLFDAFDCKFNPTRDARPFERIREQFIDGLDNVSSLPEDRTLRGLFNVIDASVRTNYYLEKPYISLKIDSHVVTSMPEPRPMVEIVVTSPTVEGIHLRGGKVARGGLRWSDRPDDFRTEVLGLMKTQMTKNAVIVPVGSKGGFVIKQAPEERDALRDYVKTQYQTFIRGMLDLTDNRVGDDIEQPKGLVIYDQPDPYLVVAADKGTATFSDVANAIALEYDFWLGDAFASGGSQGYDHKKEGITARGAWVCAERHFRELGINPKQDVFTAVGIGDMSGDVFGNGMLHSDSMKLVAAFNHLHIFLDPDPDPKASYSERKRLFELPRSSWQDYDASLMSEGGGVFSRQAKRIPLSTQIRERLAITATELSGQDLIKAILSAPVDLLWNGGIGTYVKSSTERHADVGDSSNDTVRIDADDLRARVVGEGGNLGFTQLARIEYATAGGRINTDAIDNSGGVDMSDHEVNIKILLQPLVRTQQLGSDARNDLLKQMTDEVSDLVLADNYTQSLSLSLASARSTQQLANYRRLQGYLAERVKLAAEVEFLPNRKTYQARTQAGQGLTRPELAILLAYAKMDVYNQLLGSAVPDEPFVTPLLHHYFPAVLSEQYQNALENHSLRREIIATQLTNRVVDILGMTFVQRLTRDSGADAATVVRAAHLALELSHAHDFLADVYACDYQVPAAAQYSAVFEFTRALETMTHWLLQHQAQHQDAHLFLQTYTPALDDVRGDLAELLPEVQRGLRQERHERFSAEGFSEALATTIASFDHLPSALAVVHVSQLTGCSLHDAAAPFYDIGERLSLGWLRDGLQNLDSSDTWEQLAARGLVMDNRHTQETLAVQAINKNVDTEALFEPCRNVVKHYDAILEDVQQSTLTLANASVLSRLLVQVARGTAS
jgi:glutamate dehydrogenase